MSKPIVQHKICSIDGCGNPVKLKGWCSDHYDLARRNGDPLKRIRSRRGAKLKWLEAHSEHSENECLTFPFPLGKNGYGIVTLNGVSHRAANAMCRIAHGEPPTDKHECAHSCGNGHLGCVNPNHIRWATSKENTADSISAGTLATGERHGQSQLTLEDVIEIRKRKEKVRDIAKRLGVSEWAVYDARSGRTWSWLE